MKKVIKYKDIIRFELSSNLSNEQCVWIDLHGGSYTNILTKKDCLKFINWLKKDGLKQLKQWSKKLK